VSLAARFRAAFYRRRPAVAVAVPALPAQRPLLAITARPGVRATPTPADHPVCPHCRTRHPRTLPAPSPWSTSLLPREAPLGRGQVHDEALARDRFGAQVWGRRL
jgi:hypothetical protein